MPQFNDTIDFLQNNKKGLDMSYLKLAICMGLLSGVVYSKQNQCYRYDKKDFMLKKEKYNNRGKLTENKSLNLEYIKIYYPKNMSSTKPITLEYSVSSHKHFVNFIFCMKDKKDLKWCAVECDGGGFNLKKDYSINIKYPLRLSGEPEDSSIPYIELSAKQKGYISAKKFKCPKKMPLSKDILDEKYYKDNPKGNFVCYDYKDKGKYNGCFRSIKKCKDLHLQHFGKYSSKQATKNALHRCITSKPNNLSSME